MFALVPALLKDADSERRLMRTLSRFPANADATLVLITQGNRPTVPSLPGIRAVKHEHFDSAVGKWPAVAHGLSMITPRAADAVIVLDGDDPITDASAARAFARARSLQSGYVIGDRRAILLRADDQLSSQSRIFVEIFSNTLLLLTLHARRQIPSVGPDIQSGLCILSARARDALSVDYVMGYGGELALYYELTRAGYTPSSIEIEINEATPSSYSIETIVAGIANLPFFQLVSTERLLEALDLAPSLYSRYLRNGDEKRFPQEIGSVMRNAFPRARNV